MQDEKALVPIEEQTVDFYGDEITIALVHIDGRAICMCHCALFVNISVWPGQGNVNVPYVTLFSLRK